MRVKGKYTKAGQKEVYQLNMSWFSKMEDVCLKVFDQGDGLFSIATFPAKANFNESTMIFSFDSQTMSILDKDVESIEFDEIFNSIVVLENVKVKAELFCFGTMIMKNSILDIGSIENFRVSIDVNSEIIFTECSNLDLITTDKSKKIIKKI